MTSPDRGPNWGFGTLFMELPTRGLLENRAVVRVRKRVGSLDYCPTLSGGA